MLVPTRQQKESVIKFLETKGPVTLLDLRCKFEFYQVHEAYLNHQFHFQLQQFTAPFKLPSSTTLKTGAIGSTNSTASRSTRLMMRSSRYCIFPNIKNSKAHLGTSSLVPLGATSQVAKEKLRFWSTTIIQAITLPYQTHHRAPWSHHVFRIDRRK